MIRMHVPEPLASVLRASHIDPNEVKGASLTWHVGDDACQLDVTTHATPLAIDQHIART